MSVRPLLTILAALLLSACQITPDEIERIRTENQLLREQIQVVKEKCSYYQELDLEVEKNETEKNEAEKNEAE